VAALFNAHQFEDEALRAINARQAKLLIGASAIIIILILALAIIAIKPRVPAYVVALDTKSGAVLGVAHPVAGPDTIPSAVTRYMLMHFIEGARSVSNNIDLERDRLNSVYALARGQALKAMDDYFKSDDAHNPMKQALTGHWTEVDITRCLQQPERDTYLIEWSETTHTAQGQQVVNTNWQALIKVAAATPDPNNALNPLGEYVINLDWSPEHTN
jgi:type IV secretory pathway TrbF-like protein